MTISHLPTYVLRRQSLSCRRRESLNLKDVDSSLILPPTKASHPGGTLFAAFPVELRVEVFRHFCGVYCPIDRVTDGPALILRVCRAWKELALQTPQLWTSFILHWSMPGPHKAAFLLSALEGWIKRSRNLPLSFKLHYPSPVASTCSELMQYILPSFPRWRDVTLYAPTASLLPLWSVEPTSSSCLRNLTVETFGPSPVVLKNLRIDWTQVTELDLFIIPIPTLDECFYILKEAVNLRRCSVNAACVLSSGKLESLFLPKLEHLQLKMYRLAISDAPHLPLLEFLLCLSLPELQSFSLSWNVTQAPQWSNATADGLAQFLEQWGGHLEALHMGYLPLDVPQILRCLQAVPALRQLSISQSQSDPEHDPVDNTFLDALALRATNGLRLLPHLRSIRLESHGEAFDDAALLRFIASRWKYQENISSGHLENLDLVSPNRHAEYRPRSFRDLREGRLDVAAELKSEFTMLQVLPCFLRRYDGPMHMTCFMNDDFPPDIRCLLVLSQRTRQV